jgi:hypothetical protein
MTITTEEAELLAERLANDAEAPQGARYQPYTDHAMRNAAAALQSLAAERDALRAENARLREALLFNYAGPCLAPGEMDARIATARLEGIEKAAKVVINLSISTPSVVAAAIRALAKGECNE